MPASAIRIDVLGTSLSISADESPEYLESLLEKYKDYIEDTKEKTGLSDPLKLAILSGFLIIDELEKSKKLARVSAENIGNFNSPEAEKLTLEMISRLDEVLGGNN